MRSRLDRSTFPYAPAAVILLLPFVAPLATAQPAASPPPPEQSPTVARASQLLKTLDWKAVNWDALPLRERSRSLLYLTHVLNKIDEESSARAELLSDFIDEKEWGPEFVKSRDPDEATAIS